MRILLVGHFNNGVFYHRLQVPYNALQVEGHEVLKTSSLHWESDKMVTIDELKEFNVIVFNRNISDVLDPSPIYAKAKLAGVKIIMDLDDHWDIVAGHPMYSYARKTNYSKCIQDQLRYADHITTTHSHLRNQIIKLGIDKNKVTVCRNAIDPNEPQYNQEFTTENNLMWQGSSTHAMDLELLSDVEEPIILCGYHYSDEWFKMCEKIKHPLKKDMLDVHSYMNHYHDTSISLVPLKLNKFNQNKSELKMIEAGWAKKAVIVSDIHPYSIVSNHMVNSLVCKDKSDFKKYATMLLNSQSMQDDLRLKLHEDINNRYLINFVNERRLEILNKWK